MKWKLSGIPAELQNDFEKVMKELNLDKNDENVEKAVNVAQTNYKLRNKKEEGKNMKLDKAEYIILTFIWYPRFYKNSWRLPSPEPPPIIFFR